MGKQATPVELDRAQCLRLLASGVIGRVVFTEDGLPAAQPVNYLLDGEEIIFRTSGGGKLAAATQHALVGFEVDDIDLHTRTGWSVLGVGRAYQITDIDRLVALAHPDRRPWVADRTEHTIAIPLQRLTGRRLRLDEPHPT